MDTKAVRQEIRGRWREVLRGWTGEAVKKANGETSYICPICGHGKGGDGLTFNPDSWDGNGLKCFGCLFSGDITDLYQKAYSVNHITALKELASQLRIDVDSSPTRKGTTMEKKEPAARAAKSKKERTPAQKQDFTRYLEESCARLPASQAALSYLEARGISLPTAQDYGIGFDPDADPANNPGGTGKSIYPVPRIIIPSSNAYYVGRRIDQEKDHAKVNPSGASVEIFNLQALYAPDVHEVFITEGAFDALSILEVGEAAIALCSTSNVPLLKKKLEERPTAAKIIISLDNDAGGNTAVPALREALTQLNADFITTNICGKWKDPNEALVKDREAFIAAIQAAKHCTSGKPDSVSYYIDHLMTADIDRFKSDIKTGFPNLDRKCDGLHAGLYCIAAISSLGKTTFASQMADQIAASGHDVLFFSMEQSRFEMASKSIARKVAQMDSEKAVTSTSIRNGYLPSFVTKAAAAYCNDVADRISVIEGNFSYNLTKIFDYIRKYIRDNDCRPVVFIDYLQILQPAPDQAKKSTKEMIDFMVTEIKRFSRDNSLTIFIISSVNRSNYTTPIDFESLKESGSIEYTCDVVWGLQLRCIREQSFIEMGVPGQRERIKQEKEAIPRKIELASLKNRFGKSRFSCYFDYFPDRELFVGVEVSEESLSHAERAYTPAAKASKKGAVKRG